MREIEKSADYMPNNRIIKLKIQKKILSHTHIIYTAHEFIVNMNANLNVIHELWIYGDSNTQPGNLRHYIREVGYEEKEKKRERAKNKTIDLFYSRKKHEKIRVYT